jgi:sucrose phosphorylase
VARIIEAAYENQQKPRDIDFGRFSSHRDALVSLLESHRQYLGQMDLNIKSPLVWEFYADTLKKLADYGAQIVRLDAFAYASKEPGRGNFLNDPETWDILQRIQDLAAPHGLTLLPEIHARYREKIHEKIAQQGYLVYDFFLPGLIIDAFERHTTEVLRHWIGDIQSKNIRTVNMLGCHDGIPLLDLEGLLTGEQIQDLIQTVVNRGGFVKDLHGKKNIYYQVNATYYSALGEDDRKLLLARAVQMFMPGIPQVWYLDLFAGKNNYSAVESSGSGGHKEINRTNLTWKDVQHGLTREIVQKQLLLLQFRNNCRAFGLSAELTVLPADHHELKLQWRNQGYTATLEADFTQLSFRITETDGEGNLREIIRCPGYLLHGSWSSTSRT